MLTANELKTIFEKKYDRKAWYNVLKENFNVTTLRDKPVDITSRIKANTYNAKAYELGSFNTTNDEGHLIGLYEVEVGEKVQIQRNRKGLRDLLSQVYRDDVEAALLVFVQGNKWRFSYVSEITKKNKLTGKREKKETDPKRFTYLLGEGERTKTATDQFTKIKKSQDSFGEGITLNALEEAFNVEKMSKAFFNEYRRQYGYFVAHITGEDENGKKVKNASPFLNTTFNGDHKAARDFIKKMLGRIVFLYFLEKKGWLGVEPDKKWGEGDEIFLSNLFKNSKDKKAFYSNVLAPLFFSTLNVKRRDDYFKVDASHFSKAGYDKLKIPYLNGGLFEEDHINTQWLVFPEKLFHDLFTFFDQYNFTVYEDSPDEHTVAVDPEMLGHIFENLLEDNKDKGTFYTPKEIVHYMCRQSLIEYLYTKLNPQQAESFQEIGKQQTDLYGNKNKIGQLSIVKDLLPTKEIVKRDMIEKLVLQHEAGEIIEQEEAILKALRDVKICDPAIGSGAFPMGLLIEIFHLVEALYFATPDVTAHVWKLKKDWNPAQVKMDIIQNSIYGVDIEQGAVDIARLRFWLSLVVDEDIPKPLPNLDYKIVTGNSLLSKFGEEVIDIDWNIKTKNASTVANIINEQQGKLHILQSRQDLYFSAQVDKVKLQEEIRNLKIDVLINQLTLSRIQYDESNKIQKSAFPTEKEKKDAIIVIEKIRDYNRTIHKLESLRKSKQEHLEFFDWKLDFPEVMNEKVVKGKIGFDIVIGNPPYVSFQDINIVQKKSYYSYLSATGKYDLYVLFIELSLNLLKKQGLLIFINPNKFINSQYGKGIKGVLLKNRIKEIIDFNDIQIFESATNYTCIISIQKGWGRNLVKYKNVREILNGNFEGQCIEVDQDILKSDAWIFAISSASKILDKINVYPKLKSYATDITQGLRTGSLKVYFNNINTESIDKFKIEHETIRLIYHGKNVKRYTTAVNENEDLIIFPYLADHKTPVDIEILPNLKKYLELYKPALANRKDSGKIFKNTNKKWFEFWDPKPISFQKPKIIFPDISNQNNFTIDYSGISYLNTCYAIFLKDKYDYEFILSILNSRLIEFFIRKNCPFVRGGYYRYKTNYLEKIPIPEVDKKYQKPFIDIVKRIIATKNIDPNANILIEEGQINKMVYCLYKLSYEEACEIEGGNDWMSKQDFEEIEIKSN